MFPYPPQPPLFHTRKKHPTVSIFLSSYLGVFTIIITNQASPLSVLYATDAIDVSSFFVWEILQRKRTRPY